MYKKIIKSKTEKRKSIENISDYADYKVMYKFTKLHSPNSAVIVQDKNENWFYYVLTYRTKSGIITDSSMIIGSDLETWVGTVERRGFEIKK